MIVVYLLYSVHAATIFDAIQQRGCVEATTAGPLPPPRVGSVIVHRESAAVRGRAGAGVSILPPEYEFVQLPDNDEEEGGNGAGANKATTPSAA
jgi:hypothetical protein